MNKAMSKLRLTYEGLNSEHMLNPPKKQRKITKYNNGGNEYCLIEGENIVHVSYPDSSTNEQGFTRHFLNSKEISIEEFNKIKKDLEE